MVITLGSTQTARALRVWFGELPDATYPIVTLIEFTIAAAPSVHAQARQAAVEYFRYTSPHSLDGVLGATFTPQQTDHLRVQIARSETAGTPLGWTLNPFYALDTSLFSPMVIDYVTAGIHEAAHLGTLGAGTLRFDQAAEGPPIVMRWLAEAVLAVLATRDNDTLDAPHVQEVMERGGPPHLWSPTRSVADTNTTERR